MLFNSTQFIVFFGGFLVVYGLAHRELWIRNFAVVLGSYVFYSWWDPRFTGLLLLTSLVDYSVGRWIARAEGPSLRRLLLCVSLGVNLGVLCAFKYFNFFRSSFERLLVDLGADIHWQGLNIVLPVGISFYTFQSMSYVIDVYRRRLAATGDLLQFCAYVAFFPQLVAGPIERAGNLLPQFARTLRITAAELESGFWLVVWGMFKKVVLADNLAPLVGLVYDHPRHSGPMLVLGTLAFGLQIYCDFSGYTDIARGIARWLGFELMLNFNLPYFSRTVREFWGRWHISLSTWLKDYLYIPLGGNRRGEGRLYVNLMITMLLGGLWHGAAATFVLWGAWHGAGLVVNHCWNRHQPVNRRLPGWAAWIVTQTFVFAGWMLFRAHSLQQAWQLTGELLELSLPPWWLPYLTNLALLATPLVLLDWWQWRAGSLASRGAMSRWMRAGLQSVMILTIAAYWRAQPLAFIYFQF